MWSVFTPYRIRSFQFSQSTLCCDTWCRTYLSRKMPLKTRNIYVAIYGLFYYFLITDTGFHEQEMLRRERWVLLTKEDVHISTAQKTLGKTKNKICKYSWKFKSSAILRRANCKESSTIWSRKSSSDKATVYESTLCNVQVDNFLRVRPAWNALRH